MSDAEEKETWRKNDNKVNYRRLLDAANSLVNLMESTALKALWLLYLLYVNASQDYNL